MDIKEALETVAKNFRLAEADVKVLSDNKLSVEYQTESNKYIFNYTTNINVNLLDPASFQKLFKENLVEAVKNLATVLAGNPNLVTETTKKVEQSKLAEYMAGSVAASASLATIVPSQPVILPEPFTFEQTHKIEFEQNNQGTFSPTNLKDLLEKIK